MADKKAHARRTGNMSDKGMSTKDVRVSCSSDKVDREAVLQYAKEVMSDSGGDAK